MDIKTLCLGVLTLEPASGYDIKKYIENRISHFFAAGYGSIYPALAELADAGLVTCEEIPQDGKPARKVYHITEHGREWFTDAVQKAEPRHKVRSEFMVLLHFSHMLKEHQIHALLDQRLQSITEELSGIGEYLGTMGREGEQDTPGMRFAAGLGQAMLSASQQYIRENRHMMSRPMDTPLVSPEPRPLASSPMVPQATPKPAQHHIGRSIAPWTA